MQNSFSTSNYYLNATHQANSMAAQREVASMLLPSILSGAETPTNQLTAPEGSFKRDCQRAEAQAAVIEQ